MHTEPGLMICRAQEQARQGIVLSDPAYKASPFEALRTHVRNTIAASSR